MKKTFSDYGREWLDTLVGMLSARPAAEASDITFADGLSGLLTALCGIPARKAAAAEAGRLALIARTAERIAERLREEPVWNRLREVSDPFGGLAGIGAALALADKAAGTDRYAEPVGRIFGGIGERFCEEICG